MKCPECEAGTKTIDTRMKGSRRYRRHACDNGHRFNTWELTEMEITKLGDKQAVKESVLVKLAALLPGLLGIIREELYEEEETT